MKRIALAGGPGCGKTSAARQLVTALYNKSEPKRNAQHVTEFARDYINSCKRHQGEFKPTFADQQMIFREQLRREDSLDTSCVEFMFTDSPIFLSFVFGIQMIKFTDYQQRRCYLHLYDEWLSSHTDRYDWVFLLSREKSFFQDGTRVEDALKAAQIDEQIRGFLQVHGIEFICISGEDDERVSKILKLIT